MQVEANAMWRWWFLFLLSVGYQPAGAQGSSREVGKRPGRTSQLRPIEAADAAAWKRIEGATLSRDGKWFAYTLRPNEGNGELILRSTGSDEEVRLPVGDGGGRFAFTATNRWLVYLVSPNRDSARHLPKNGKIAMKKVVILELASRRSSAVDSIQNFTLDGERGRTVVLEPLRPAEGPSESRRDGGRELILYDLADGTSIRRQHVGEFAFDATGKWLAWTVADSSGGVTVRDMDAGLDHILDGSGGPYKSLKWAARFSDRLAVLKGSVDAARADTLYQLLWWTDVSHGATSAGRFDAQHDPGAPAGMTISASQPPRWSESGDAIFFGIRAPRAPATGVADEKANVVVWHWKDPRVQSQQQKEKARDDAYAYPSVYHLNTKRFVRLADDTLRDVIVAPHDRYAIAWNVRPYEADNWMTGHHHVDLYSIDASSGEKRLLAKRFLLIFGISGRVKRFFLSPDGAHVLTWADSAYQVRDLRTGDTRALIAKGGPQFGTIPSDYSPHKAPIEPVAWSREGDVVVLSDGWDLWAVPLDGRAPTNLTVEGRRTGVRYGRPLPELIGLDPIIGYGTATVDLSKPWYISAMGYWTKDNGIIRIDGSRPGTHPLLWGEMGWLTPLKARDADVVAFSRGTVVEYPNYYLTDLSFSKPRQVTDANPQQREYLWPSGVVMVNYRGPTGGRLQAAVWLPANYQRGKRYPAIVSIYERDSFMRNHYTTPLDEVNAGGTGVDPTTYAGRGYAMIFPDIDFAKGRPGTSALYCILAAARAAVAAGIVDSTRVGLTGHSWGGYESSFVPTQTSFFRAVLTSAPITDMVSEYGGIYWGSGEMLTAQGESDQLRMGRSYWEDPQRYIRESAVFHVDKVTTPILLVHNDKDDAVDWRQGIEYYNALRRAKKPVVMLQYAGQGHGTGGAANIRDLKLRAREFFDHFLMGRPAPMWWTAGVPNQEMDHHLTQRR